MSNFGSPVHLLLKVAARSLPSIVQSIKHHQETLEYNPSEILFKKIVACLKTFIFSLTLEVKPSIIYLKLENLAKILYLVDNKLNILNKSDIINAYKVLLQVMSKAKIKMNSKTMSQRVWIL
jgi:hypothetical protein